MSLRARLVAVASALVVAGLVVAAVVSYTLLRSSLLDKVDAQLVALQRPAERVLLRPSGPGGGPLERGLEGLRGAVAYYQVRSGGDVVNDLNVVLPDSPAWTPKLPDQVPGDVQNATAGVQVQDAHTFTVPCSQPGGPSFRVRTTPLLTGQTLLIAVPLADVARTLDRFRNIELLVTAVVGLLVAALSFYFVRLGLRPLTGMARTADEIAAGDLSQRVSPSEGRTEIGRLGNALNTMLSKIESAFAERQRSEDRLRRFVADASHELRTPLTSIRGYAELFRRGAASRPDDLAKAMSRIEDEAARMGVLVEELLLLARLDQGRPLESQPVDLSALATDAVADARVVEPQRTLDLDVDGPVVVDGDAVRLRQVLDNLLANVRTHTPVSAAARVRVRAEDHTAVLEVEDHGPGMVEEQQARAFERFYRVDPSRSRDSGGVGLGLSIVSAIVEAHGGNVGLRSSPGHGSTFRIELPMGTVTPSAG
jgi:two-component system, OmpR family, sensor kinase